MTWLLIVLVLSVTRAELKRGGTDKRPLRIPKPRKCLPLWNLCQIVLPADSYAFNKSFFCSFTQNFAIISIPSCNNAALCWHGSTPDVLEVCLLLYSLVTDASPIPSASPHCLPVFQGNASRPAPLQWRYHHLNYFIVLRWTQKNRHDSLWSRHTEWLR